MLRRLDHVNVYTHDLPRFIGWYETVLGMKSGARPPFSFAGAWLYVGDAPVVHVTEVESARENVDPGIEHFALTAADINAFLDHLDTHNVAYRTAIVPEFGIIQVNVHDPDGNHIHIDFDKSEQAQLRARAKS